MGPWKGVDIVFNVFAISAVDLHLCILWLTGLFVAM